MIISLNEGRLIKILNSTTEDSLKELQEVLNDGRADKLTLTTAHIKYDCEKGIGKYGSAQYYPLILKGTDIEIRVSCVTSGYHGEGPRGMAEALKIAGFNVTPQAEKIIFGCKKTHHYMHKYGA